MNELFSNMGQLFTSNQGILLPVGILIVCSVCLWTLRSFLIKRQVTKHHNNNFKRPLITASIVLAIILLAIILLPLDEALRGQLVTIIGLLISAILAMSSTTFAANAMGGLMIKAVNNFKPGDFIRVESHWGRVSEVGLFHTEIQTEDRDLLTIPNLYLVTHPVQVAHQSGSVISAEVSIGYDINHSVIEKTLLKAIKKADLDDGFVQIRELGDYAVTYRAAGFLSNISTVVSIRSKLRREMLDALHGAKIEIVSPSFMNQRPQASDSVMIPQQAQAKAKPTVPTESIDDKLFDKAIQAEQLTAMHDELKLLLDALTVEQKNKIPSASKIKRLEKKIQIANAHIKAATLDD